MTDPGDTPNHAALDRLPDADPRAVPDGLPGVIDGARSPNGPLGPGSRTASPTLDRRGQAPADAESGAPSDPAISADRGAPSEGRPDSLDRDAYRHVTTISLRWADNDAYGHVNNVVYYAWFDSAVNDWLVGQGLLDIHAGDPIGLVVETGCRYFAPLAFPGTVEVGLRVSHIGRTSITYGLGIFAPGDDRPAAQGHFTHVMVDRATRRPVAIPDDWRAALGTLA